MNGLEKKQQQGQTNRHELNITRSLN